MYGLLLRMSSRIYLRNHFHGIPLNNGQYLFCFLKFLHTPQKSHTMLKEIIPKALSFDKIVTVTVLGEPSFIFADCF